MGRMRSQDISASRRCQSYNVASSRQMSADMKALHQFFAGLHGKLWAQAAEHFLTALRVHGRQLAHEFVARFPFRITTTADANRKQRRYYPNGDVSSGDHQSIQNKIENWEFGSTRRARTEAA